MYQYYFPACPVEGQIDPPMPFAHLMSRGTVPYKCHDCQHLFEGSCIRFYEQVGHFMYLDHGSCPVEGATEPTIYEDQATGFKADVPKKCTTCHLLKFDSIFKFYCAHDKEKWGDFPRGLDWGAWTSTDESNQ